MKVKMTGKAATGGVVFVLSIWLLFVLAWFINGYKLTQCDFAAPYKCEAIHAAGLIGPLAALTVWYGGD